MEIQFDRDVDAAYVSLLPEGERTSDVSKTTVPLESLPEAQELDALHSILLDFDDAGRLIGLEILSARKTLRESTLRSST